VGHTVVDLIDFFGKVVGDPGIEPGMGYPGGVTVHCRTLQLVALVGPCRKQGREQVLDTDHVMARQ
jgi:hypothetical protein